MVGSVLLYQKNIIFLLKLAFILIFVIHKLVNISKITNQIVSILFLTFAYMIWATRNIERNVIPLLYNLSEAVKLPLPPNFQKMPFSLPGGVFRLSDVFFWVFVLLLEPNICCYYYDILYSYCIITKALW